jgi:hypothetical protein
MLTPRATAKQSRLDPTAQRTDKQRVGAPTRGPTPEEVGGRAATPAGRLLATTGHGTSPPLPERYTSVSPPVPRYPAIPWPAVNDALVGWLMTPEVPDETLTLEDFLHRPEWHQRAACRGVDTDAFMGAWP